MNGKRRELGTLTREGPKRTWWYTLVESSSSYLRCDGLGTLLRTRNRVHWSAVVVTVSRGEVGGTVVKGFRSFDEEGGRSDGISE